MPSAYSFCISTKPQVDRSDTSKTIKLIKHKTTLIKYDG